VAKDRNFNVDFAARVDSPYWAGLERGELRIQRCAGCGDWIWPAEWRCGVCGSFESEWPLVEPIGEVYTWTRTHYPFVAGYEVPYVHVLVALTGAGGRRLLGLLTGPDDGLCIGARVRGHVDPPSELTLDLPALRWSLA
jgi:uncharacterized OB-fold protein